MHAPHRVCVSVTRVCVSVTLSVTQLADDERDFKKAVMSFVERKVDKKIKIENPEDSNSTARCMICNKLFKEKKYYDAQAIYAQIL